MWFTIKLRTDNEPAEPEAVVTTWGPDERPFRVGCLVHNIGDVVAFVRFLAHDSGSTPPRCNHCDAPVAVPDFDSYEEAA